MKNSYGERGVTEMGLSMNRIKSFGLLLSGVIIFLMVFSSAAVFAQTGTLEVTCEGPSGAPEKDVTVTVMPITVNKGSSKKSNTSGVALFDKLNNGPYRIVARKAGFAPALHEAASVNNGKTSVTLKLANGADSKLYFEDPAVERRSNVLLEEGTRAIEAGRMDEAEKFLAQSLEIKPFAADTLYYYGLAQARQGKFDEAMESYKKAASTANLMMSALPKPKPMGPGGPDGGAPKPNPADRQRVVYEMLIANSEQQIVLMPLMKADMAYELKKFDEAVSLYDEAINNNPQNPAIYSNKALALTQAGRFDEALASVNRALEMNPGDERASQVKKAVDAFIENAAREKENATRKQANDILNEGTKLLDSDAAAALKNFLEANKLTGEQQSVIWRQVGRAHAKLKQDTEAVAAFRKAIELASEDQVESYQMSLAQYYLDAKRPDEALDVVVAGAKDPEQRLMDLYTMGKNNPDSMAFSTAALERVVKLNPSNFDAVYELGVVCYMDRKDSQAQELLNRYIENGKDDTKIQTAKDFLTVLASRNKPK